MSSKIYLRILWIALGAMLPLIILIALLPDPANSVPASLLAADILVIMLCLVLRKSKLKEEQIKNYIAKDIEARAKAEELKAKEAERQAELHQQYETKRKEAAALYERNYQRVIGRVDPSTILEFKVQKTLSEERQENIALTLLYEPLELVESITDDSCAVRSSAGTVGEFSASAVKQIAGGSVYFTELLADDNGNFGMRVQVIPNAQE